jgi:hypothetical protein
MIDIGNSSEKVLGLSEDKSVKFSLGFVYHYKHLPYIRVDHANGEDGAIYIKNPYRDNILVTHRVDSFALSQSANSELHAMLDATDNIMFIPFEQGPADLEKWKR